MNGGDSVFVLIAALLVWLMTPGLGLFYAGLGEEKNRVYTLKLTLMVIGLVTLLWFTAGYSLAFANHSTWLGRSQHFFFQQLAFDHSTRGLSIADANFAFFQGTFAILTVMIITGSVIGRMRTGALLLFLAAWLFTVYAPLADMVWNNGWLAQLGAIDFAGGTVVHISSGVTALVLALVVGPRLHTVEQPENPWLTFIGGLLLCFGWFGFNGGSALAANGQALLALVNTALAASKALLVFADCYRLKGQPVTLAVLLNGALAGLVAITPAAGYVDPWAAVLIGILAAPIIAYALTTVKAHFGYDDTLDAFGLHGVGGMVGALLTGVFASKAAGAPTDGLIHGQLHLFINQGIAVLVSVVLAGLGTALLCGFLRCFLPTLRVTPAQEKMGLK
ncbi:ammonium transporter [Leuconostocaceae bacterium ESL0958]|nr:ammonium transporter [Leuconostocaceae bacterium ESL0958]